MNERLHQLRDQIWEEPSERELHIRELEEETGRLEQQVLEIAESLSDGQRMILEGYVYTAAELEMYNIIQSFQRGKALGEQIGKTPMHY